MNKYFIPTYILLVLILALLVYSLFQIKPKDKDAPVADSAVASANMYYSCSIDGETINTPSFVNYIEGHGVSDTPLLVISYSSFSCKSCLDFIIENLKSNISGFDTNENILFVASKFGESANIRYGNTIFLGQESLGLDAEDTDTPCVFVYINNEIRHFIMPSSVEPGVFETYLSTIRDRYSF